MLRLHKPGTESLVVRNFEEGGVSVERSKMGEETLGSADVRVDQLNAQEYALLLLRCLKNACAQQKTTAAELESLLRNPEA